MKTFITAFPIDKPFQIELGIYYSGDVKSISVGKTLHRLIKAGYTNMNSYTINNKLIIHCEKPR